MATIHKEKNQKLIGVKRNLNIIIYIIIYVVSLFILETINISLFLKIGLLYGLIILSRKILKQ